MSFSTFSQTPHYSAEVIAGKKVSEWFVGFPFTEIERNKITWGILHICFAFWYEFADPILSEKSLESLLFICEKFRPGLLNFLSPSFIIYYYHFVVSKYGHLPKEAGYCDYIRGKVEEYQQGIDIIFAFPENHQPVYELRRPVVRLHASNHELRKAV